MSNERNPLYKRSKLMGRDVAEAIRNLKNRDEVAFGKLPVAFSKDQITREVVDIANTLEDGTIQRLSKSARRFSFDRFLNSLNTTSVFQSGYLIYEQWTNLPIVPATAYFFNHVYEDDARELVDAMTEVDIINSLPKRESIVRNEEGKPVADENGKAIIAGKIAGVVIFPPGSKSTLLEAWLRRLNNMAVGQLNSSLDALDDARPGSPRVADLRDQATQYKKDVRKAIPYHRAKP